MKPRLIAALCTVAVLAGAASVASAQQAKPAQAQKAPSAEAKAEKKPNIVVLKLSGTPKPTKKPERPKGVPRFQPLPNAEKLKIAQLVIPQISGTGTPYLTLFPGHLTDTHGYLTLCWPEYVQYWLARYVQVLPAQNPGESQLCSTGSDNQQHVELGFDAEGNYGYVLDFFIAVIPGQVDSGLRDLEVQISGFAPTYPTANAGWNHLFATFCPQSSGHYTAQLELKPRGDSQPFPNSGPWWFIAAEVTQFQVTAGCPPPPSS